MNEPRILARDRITGKLVLFHVLPDGRFVVETQVDVEPILEQNAELRRLAASGWKGDLHHVASIPMVMHQAMRTEGIIQDKRDFSKWLNDSANSKFRTKTGKV